LTAIADAGGRSDGIMSGHLGEVEARLRAALVERLGETRFALWFGEGVQLGIADDALEVRVPNAFFREWIQGHFSGNLIAAAEEVTGRSVRLAFEVADEPGLKLGHATDPLPPGGQRQAIATVPPGPPAHAPASQPAPTATISSERPRIIHRPPRRLDDFVTGSCNRLAHAAAVEMVRSAGATFNPLLIHGGVGLGKTHLLEAIGHGLRAGHAGLKVVQATAEVFTNSFLDAIRTGGLNPFRSRFRSAGALLVDDVHFLAAKRATQDEFLHTFNALFASGVPIVMAADQHPRKIARLTDELATRFLGGMVVKLDVPDLATRRAILRAKAAARGVDLPEVVLGYVAEHLRSSVRELEGALHSLLAHVLLTGKRLDLSLARTALRDTIRNTAQSVALRDVERAVCQLFAIDADSLKSDSRARTLTYPRMLAMYLARKHIGLPYSEIGRYFGDRNHSTVIAAEKKVLSWLRDEDQTQLLAGFESISDVLGTLERALGGS
jgi:chromosomal replication initiator protein